MRRVSTDLSSMRAPLPLRDLPIWCVWNSETFDNEPKPRKVPYYTHGGRRYGKQGDAQDRAKLTTFEEAKKAAIRRGMTGVGFALLSSDGRIVIDLDKCFKDGKLDPAVAGMIGGTYAEYSPSGEGAHAIYVGDASILGNRKAGATAEVFGIEAFSSSGFVTFTGRPLEHVDLLGSLDRIAPIPQALVDYARERFSKSYSDRPDVGPDDFMVGHEPVHGMDYDEMERLIGQLDPDMGREHWIKVGMALHHETDGDDTGFTLWDEWSQAGGKYPGEEGLRTQWDSFDRRKGERRPNTTMATVKRMSTQAEFRLEPIVRQVAAEAQRMADVPRGPLPRTPEGFEGKWPVRSGGDLANEPAPGWLIKGLIPKAELGIIYGPSGSGKSFVLLQLAAHLSLGLEWRGLRVTKTRVLIVVAEGAGGYGARVKALAESLGVQPDDLEVGFITAAPNILETEDVTHVCAAALAVGAQMVCWDTYAQVTPGADENSAQDMGRALANLRIVREATAAMNVLVAHAGKDVGKGVRGWSGLHAAADFVIEVVRPEEGPREIKTAKLKDGRDDQSYTFKLEQVVTGVDADGDVVTTCLVVPTDETPASSKPAKAGRSLKRRGRFETHVLEMVETLGTRDSINLMELVDVCTKALPTAGPGERDTRRQNIARAIRSLAKEVNAPVGIEGGVVIFYT